MFDGLALQKYLHGLQMELHLGKIVVIVLGAKICKTCKILSANHISCKVQIMSHVKDILTQCKGWSQSCINVLWSLIDHC